MKSDKQLWDICMEIYRASFKAADPSADFDHLIKIGETKKDKFYMNYYISDSELARIVDKICAKHKLTKFEKNRVSQTVYLGCVPTSIRQTIEVK